MAIAEFLTAGEMILLRKGYPGFFEKLSQVSLRGDSFREIFDILGDRILCADSDSWIEQRKTAHMCFKSMEFRKWVNETSLKEVGDYLLPLLTQAARKGCTVDLQDVFLRFTFNTTMNAVFGRDLKYLTSESPNTVAQGIDEAQEALTYRVLMPTLIWKLQRWLNVGAEKKLAKAREIAERFIEKCISVVRDDFLRGVEKYSLLTTYMKLSKTGDKFLRDTTLNVLVAGRETTASTITWFIWLTSRNPRVEEKIIEELRLVVSEKKVAERDEGGVEEKKQPWVFHPNDLRGLVYLHAACCETLRLYPSIPVTRRVVMKNDVLPDGSSVGSGMQILVSYYSLGRMPWLWGEDCLEFKPERWINEDGTPNQEKVSKLFAFSISPRTCIGKDLALTQMKLVTATLLFNFHVQVAEGQSGSIRTAINLLG
ncbi:PREDICTED: cytochrome P450 86A7-like [Nelumbo nucifera]|uniref:Cytochrome P450 86A7-like n=1 Tax=Nelumbo nucifera TaxID=4432 RepID=A0A1U8QBR0_NELNU|nr:PREDICTED: cytochrome P450 86A7-like [Nelumbo nucifera]